jgi:hypothetical protein
LNSAAECALTPAAGGANLRRYRSASMDRRTVLGGLLVAATPAGAKAADNPAGPGDALLAFLKAFERCDLDAMQAAFADDATCFDRIVLSAKATPGIDLAHYRRLMGMPPGMRQVALSLPKDHPGPPYQDLTPKDLMIQAGRDMAVCTFHLDYPHILCRRTVVLGLRSGAWKIIHIHASNVDDSA